MTTSHGNHAPPMTKLAPPELRTPSHRADQLEQVASAVRARLALVRAPAGYGKTTLIAAAAAELDWRCVWYRLDLLDADPRVFLAALTHALAAHVPQQSAAAFERQPSAAPSSIAEAAVHLATEYGLAADGGELFLVLDDYEVLAEEEAFNTALAALLSYLPVNVHLVLLSRARPSFPTGKLTLAGELAEIDHRTLRFESAQAVDVIEREVGAPPSPAAVEILLSLTEGWPAGVLLAAAACRRAGRATLDEMLSDDLPRATFPYLEEEVYTHLDADAQSLLQHTCCLTTVTAGLAETVSAVPEAGRLLTNLEADGAFTFAADAPGEYRHHPLLRSFLQERLAAKDGQAALSSLRRRSAAALAHAGQTAAAVELYLDAGDAEETVGLLRDRRHGLLDGCSPSLLARWAVALGEAKSDLLGWATLLEGRSFFLTGDLIAARRRLAAALPLLSDETHGRYLTLRTLCGCCSAAGMDNDAVTYAREAVETSEDDDRASSLRNLAQMLVLACRWQELEEVQAEFDGLAAVPAELAANMMLTRIHSVYTRGDVGAALTMGEEALPVVRRDARRLALGDSLTGLAGFSFYTCRYAQGMRYAEEARRVLGAHAPRYARAQLDAVWAMLVAQQGRLRESLAILDGLTTDPLLRTIGGVLCLTQLARGAALRRAGEPARAMQFCRLALDSLPRNTGAYDTIDARIDLASLEGLLADPGHATTRLHTLRADAQAHGLRFQAGKAGFFLGTLSFRADEDGGAELARSCGELLALGHLDFLGQELVADPETAARLLTGTLSTEQERELLRVIALQVGGPPTAASLADGDRTLRHLISLARTDLPQEKSHQLLQALRRHPSKEVRDRVRRLDLSADATTPRLFLELTDREEEVLALLAEGCSNAQIAQRLVLSMGTVKTHAHRIFTKTGAHGRLAAAMLYRERLEARSAPRNSRRG